MLFLGILLGLILGLVLKGKLVNLVDLKFRAFYLVLLSLAIQLAILASPLSKQAWVIENGALIYILSLDLLMIGLMLNWKLGWGFRLVILGTALNFLVIIQNEGTIPVDLNKLADLDGTSVSSLSEQFSSHHQLSYRHPLNPNSQLSWLGDVIEISLPLLGGNIYSIGDIYIAVGLAWFVPAVMLRKVSYPETQEVSPAASLRTEGAVASQAEALDGKGAKVEQT